MNFRRRDKDGLFKSIFTAYFILLLHVFLLAGVGLTVVLFKGVYHYLPWIMAGIGILVLSIAWIFYRRMRESSSQLRDILSVPEFRDRTVEVRLLGGLASFTVKAREERPLLPDHGAVHPDTRMIEDGVARTERKMLELNTLFEKNLISRHEFEKAKQNLIQG
ncbi:hypothetical protein [Desulfospira joergensenii]|uniref:hypothetical protein n=1 Tax=Desulfospira joergensenii TaxID=53329 RepID=UPI0003B4D6C1|nr:hypothetical protein [Desulfospira joergensenii]